jgi:hypothetical protein
MPVGQGTPWVKVRVQEIWIDNLRVPTLWFSSSDIACDPNHLLLVKKESILLQFSQWFFSHLKDDWSCDFDYFFNIIYHWDLKNQFCNFLSDSFFYLKNIVTFYLKLFLLLHFHFDDEQIIMIEIFN